MLKPRLGNQWKAQWSAAGFTNNSLAGPNNPMVMLQQFRTYFAANPTHEVASLNATAAACTAAAEAISTAASTSNQKNADAGSAKSNLETGISKARKRLGGLRDELGQLLKDDDDLWYAFGFSKPSDPDTPEVPENLVITPGAPGGHMVFIDWDDSLRSTSYRVIIKKNAAGNPELKNLIVTDSEATITDIPSGTQIIVTIAGRNSKGGESGPSAPLNTTVP